MTGSRQHPTISDVALALAQRQGGQSKVALERLERYVKISVEVVDGDVEVAAAKCRTIFAELDAEYPRENGGDK